MTRKHEAIESIGSQQKQREIRDTISLAEPVTPKYQHPQTKSDRRKTVSPTPSQDIPACHRMRHLMNRNFTPDKDSEYTTI